jgi:hypothetical protein
MPNDELKKSNDINGLRRCPQGSDVGVFGRAKGFADALTASFIYGQAISDLTHQTLEVQHMLETMDEEETAHIKEEVEKTALELDAKWAMAAAMLGIQS